MTTWNHSNLRALVGAVRTDQWADDVCRQLVVDPSLLLDKSGVVTRAELAQALNMILFDDLVHRVPVAHSYVREACAEGCAIEFDHGAVRTVAWPCGELPPGEAAVTRILRPLGFRLNGTYPLVKLGMTGRSWCHEDLPEAIAQFFVSELHPERFTPAFQGAVTRVIGNSRDPLEPCDQAILEQLARDRSLPFDSAVRLLSRLPACFDRQHGMFQISDYESLLAESAEMAWIATEGNAFNHATHRVQDVEAVARAQRDRGRPMKEIVEISKSGRVRQTAFRAAEVRRSFLSAQGQVERTVPGSFYEFISRARLPDGPQAGGLDLQFDAGNATAIFGMTAQGRM